MTTKELDQPIVPHALVEAQAAVRTFLQEALPEVHRVDITGSCPSSSTKGPGKRMPWFGSPTPPFRPWGCPRSVPCSIRTSTWSGWTGS